MPKGVYERTPDNKPKPRSYPADVVAAVRRMYADEGMTVREVQGALPAGYKAQRIIERHVPRRRPTGKRDQRGDRNDSWVGLSCGYDAAHERVKRARGSASGHPCVDCGLTARDWSYQGGCPDERRDPGNGCAYSPHPEMYAARCRTCHSKYDSRTRLSDGRYAPRGGDAHVC